MTKFIKYIFEYNEKELRANIIELFKIIDSTIEIDECPFYDNGFFNKQKIQDISNGKPSIFVTFYGKYGPTGTKLIVYDINNKYFFDSIINYFNVIFDDNVGIGNIEDFD